MDEFYKYAKRRLQEEYDSSPKICNDDYLRGLLKAIEILNYAYEDCIIDFEDDYGEIE